MRFRVQVGMIQINSCYTALRHNEPYTERDKRDINGFREQV
jgi:hypothetical protein